MLLNFCVGEHSWESFGLQGDQTSQSWRKLALNINWKDWWWSLNSNTLATWCKELTHLKGPWCWGRLKAGGEGMTEDEMVGWHHQLDGHEFEQVGSWWWTRRPGVLQSTGSQSWTQLSDWTERIDAFDKAKHALQINLSHPYHHIFVIHVYFRIGLYWNI